MRVTILGTGYVGLTTGVALAYLGHQVHCIDRNPDLVAALAAGRVPLHEPGLPGLLTRVRDRIRFHTALTPAALAAEVFLICVGTPPGPDGHADLSGVESAARAIAAALPAGSDAVVATKSTVPVGTAGRVAAILAAGLGERGVAARVRVAANPEFLREGAALADFLYPDRVLVGAEDPEAVDRLRRLYAPILQQSFPPPPGLPRPEGKPPPVFVTVRPASAELAKYAANAFLAMKISFANEMAGLAERVGADITEVMRAVGLDPRIGPRYLEAGAGWGGSCLGKDLQALLALGRRHGYPLHLAAAAVQVNEAQRAAVAAKVAAALGGLAGRTVALWGLTFKPGTDDLRDSPAIAVARRLLAAGARVRAYDPVGMARARAEHPDLGLEYAASPEEAAAGADALVLMTAWDVFRHVDWQAVAARMRGRAVVDARNALDPAVLGGYGFQYWGIGR